MANHLPALNGIGKESQVGLEKQDAFDCHRLGLPRGWNLGMRFDLGIF